MSKGKKRYNRWCGPCGKKVADDHAHCTARGCEKPIGAGRYNSPCLCRDVDHSNGPRHVQCCGGPSE